MFFFRRYLLASVVKFYTNTCDRCLLKTLCVELAVKRGTLSHDLREHIENDAHFIVYQF